MRVSGYRRISTPLWTGLLTVSAACAVGTSAASPASATPVTAHRCSGTAYTWTGNGDATSWSDQGNWDPSGDPGSCGADSVDIPVEANITFCR